MSATYRRRPGRMSRPTAIALLGATIGLLAGCGGSSTPKRTPQRAAQTPAQSNADAGTAYAQVRGGGGPAPTSSRTAASAQRTQSGIVARVQGPTVEHARPTPTQSNDDRSSAPPAAFNPCSLVSVSEAHAITGIAIAGRTEAPLGPTCVYKLSGSKASITLAVESLNLSQVAHQLTRAQTVIVGSRRAYCGRLGTPMLFAPVIRGRVLNVTAPCAIAQRFATLALGRLAA
jgi:hypothetical protein